jgi:hypothetical protein
MNNQAYDLSGILMLMLAEIVLTAEHNKQTNIIPAEQQTDIYELTL